MTASTTLQLKISRTRKRLSNSPWYVPLNIIACFGVLVLLASLLRAVSLAGSYGVIDLDIPVLSVPLDDKTLSRLKPTATENLALQTPMVFLSREAYIFGTTESFTTDISNIRNKFYIPHEDGAPNLPRLISDMERWAKDSKINGKTISTELVILLPQEEIPLPIVLQTIDGLKQSGLFAKVVLGGGLL